MVTVRVRVKNSGEIEASNVIVALYVNGREIERTSLYLVRPGSDQLVTFTWRAVGGTPTLKVEIDPDNQIIEIFEDNNVKTTKVDVATQSAVMSVLKNKMVSSIFIFLIVMVVIALIMLTLIKRRGTIWG